MTNIPQKSWKCWFHLIGIYVVTGITISALESEFIVYAKFRHEFLKQTKAHLRTVLVDGIPHKLRNPVVLRAYLDLLYPGAVKHICLGINIKYLQRLVDERSETVVKLERAMYSYYISHNRPKVRVGKMTHEVDAIVYYTQLLDSLNKNIQKEQQRVRQVAGLLPNNSSDPANNRSAHESKSVGSLEDFLRLTEIKLPRRRAQSSHSSRRNLSSSNSSDGVTKRKDAKKIPATPALHSDDDYQKLSYQYQSSGKRHEDELDVESDETRQEEGLQSNKLFQRSHPPTHTPIFAYDAFRAVERDEDDDVDDHMLGIEDPDYEDFASGVLDSESQRRRQLLAEEDDPYTSGLTWSQWFRRMWSSPTLSECWMVVKYGMYSDIDEEVVLHRRSSTSPSSSSSTLNLQMGRDGSGVIQDEDIVDVDEEENGDHMAETDQLISSTQHDRRLFLSRAFVTFRSFTAATTAKQVIHMQLAGRLIMTEAPEPTDITWVNMYMTRRATWFRQYLVDAFIILLIIVWVAPVTLLSYIFSYDAVTAAIPSLKTLAENYNIVESMIDLLQPIVLVGIMNLLPPLLMALGVFEGSIALSVNQFRAYNRYFAFQIINVFLVNAIAGSVIDAITTVYDSPPSVFSMLGNSLPKMGGFFTNYLLVKALTGLGMELIRVPAIFMSLGKKLFTPDTTPRDRQNLFYGGAFRNVTNPGWFPFHKIYAQDMLLFVICATYSCVAPFTLLAGIAYFFLASIIYKHQMIYIYEPMYETGGKWWPIMARGMVVALLFAQALLTGMFILKETFTELYLLIVLFAITLTYYFHAASIYTPLAEHLPLDMAMALDEHHGQTRRQQRRQQKGKKTRRPKGEGTSGKSQRDGETEDTDDDDVGDSLAEDMTDADDYLQPSVRAQPMFPEVEFLDREATSKITNSSTFIV